MAIESIERLLAARMVSAKGARAGQRQSTVFIKDLVLLCSIGVYPEERLALQRVRINVEIDVREPEGPLNDEIGNVLSYDAVITAIRARIAEGHINLVETLAHEVAEICLADTRAEAVRVRIEKLDVVPDAASVGVEIQRQRVEPAASVYPLPSALGLSRPCRGDGQD